MHHHPTLQDALERWESAMPRTRDGRRLSDVDQILRARCELIGALLEQGWQAPAPVLAGRALDLTLLGQSYGVIERRWGDDPASPPG